MLWKPLDFRLCVFFLVLRTIVNILEDKRQIWCSYLACLVLYFQAIAEIGVDMTHCGFSGEREIG